jgi:hypothetical protein
MKGAIALVVLYLLYLLCPLTPAVFSRLVTLWLFSSLLEYNSFIVSNFNYCPLTWHFCGEKFIKNLEKIQEITFRFIYDDYQSNYDSLLRSKLTNLKLRRIRTITLEIHKIIHKQWPTYYNDLVNIKAHTFNFRYKDVAIIPQVRTTSYGSNSFCSYAPNLWTFPPQYLRLEVKHDQFKSLIEN